MTKYLIALMIFVLAGCGQSSEPTCASAVEAAQTASRQEAENAAADAAWLNRVLPERVNIWTPKFQVLAYRIGYLQGAGGDEVVAANPGIHPCSTLRDALFIFPQGQIARVVSFSGRHHRNVTLRWMDGNEELSAVLDGINIERLANFERVVCRGDPGYYELFLRT